MNCATNAISVRSGIRTASFQAVSEEFSLLGSKEKVRALGEVLGWRRQFGMPGEIQHLAPAIVFFSSLLAAPPQTLEIAVEVLSSSLITADIVLPQSRPIYGTRQPLQPLFRDPAENASIGTVGLEQWLGEVQFQLSRPRRNFTRGSASRLQVLVNPWDEEHVSEPGLNRAGSGEKVIGEGIPDAAEP